MNSHALLSPLLAGLITFGCVGSDTKDFADDDVVVGGADERDDSIRPHESPDELIEAATFRLGDIIAAADVGKVFGTDSAHIPYPDTYWPMVNEGIDARWLDAAGESPLEKYMELFDAGNKAAAKDWEHRQHGAGVPGVADWFGHCPGWTGAALSNARLRKPISVRSDGKGGLASCRAGSAGCVRFEIGDINALMAEVYNDSESAFIGARCDTKPKDIERDKFGRIVRNGTGCQGLNAGAMLVTAGNIMKRRHKGFAIDAQNEANTDQIWNQPAYRYKVYRYEPLTEAQAANLVATGKKEGGHTVYKWNAQARGWVFVDIGLRWVSEQGPNTTMISGSASTQETRMVAVIELDGPGTNADSKIIGGEYLDDASVGANRLRVAPFVWVANGPGPEDLPIDIDGDMHNPYVKPSLVHKLVKLAQ